MGYRENRMWMSIVLSILFCASLHAEQLTVESLIGLQELGFGEVEIQEQIKQSGNPVQLTDTDIETLTKAGFSEEMIHFLRNPLPAAEPPVQPRVGTGQDRLIPKTPERPTTEPEDPPVIQQPQSPETKRPVVFNRQVLEIQQYLNQLGYDAGMEDGIMGRRTAAAIRSFQQDMGFSVDGQASARLLAQLKTQTAKQGGTRDRQGQGQRLVGSWQSVYQGNYGYSTEMYLDLFPDGTFTSSSSSAMGYAEATGTYTIKGNVLTLQNQYGQVENYRFRRSGQQLIVNMPQVGEDVVFTRYSWDLQ